VILRLCDALFRGLVRERLMILLGLGVKVLLFEIVVLLFGLEV